jgi:hypothetical protein
MNKRKFSLFALGLLPLTAWANEPTSDKNNLVAQRSTATNKSSSEKKEVIENVADDTYIYHKRPPEPTFGFGAGFGLNPYPTTRLELGWHGRKDMGFISAAYEATWFSKQHTLARALLLETFERDINQRRILLNWRPTDSGLFPSIFVGYENQSTTLLKPINDENTELQRVIKAARQSYLFGFGLSSVADFSPVRIDMQWLGLSLRKDLRSAAFTNREPGTTDDDVNKEKSDFNSDSKLTLRFLNFTAFFDF